MKTNINSLRINPVIRFLSRHSRNCTVVLSTGKEISFEMCAGIRCFYYEGGLEEKEEKEYWEVVKVLGY